MSETIFSLEEIAEAFKYIQDDKLSTDAKAMLTMDIGYKKAENDIIKLLEDHGQYMNNHEVYAANRLIAFIKGEK